MPPAKAAAPASDAAVHATPLALAAHEERDVDEVTEAVLTASRLLMAVSARSISAVDEAVTFPQFRLLVVLHTRGPIKLTTLADHLGVNPSTATRTVDRLIATGMVNRETSPNSRRETVVTLTVAGDRVVRAVTEHRRAEIARIVERMSASTRRGLVDALVAFADAGDEPPAGRAAFDPLPKLG